MTEEEIKALQEKLIQSDKIITILLQENERLSEQIALLSAEIGKSGTRTSLISEENGKSGSGTSLSDIDKGKFGINASDIHVESGNIGSPTSLISVETGKSGSSSSDISIPMNEKNVQLLASQLHYRGRKSGRKNMARILLHIYNRQSGSHTAFGALTHLTPSGTAKTIHYMKKRGLIQRTGFRKFALTPLSQQLMEKSGAG